MNVMGRFSNVEKNENTEKYSNIGKHSNNEKNKKFEKHNSTVILRAIEQQVFEMAKYS